MWARVMPGVRRLVAKQEDEKFGADYRARENQLRLASGAWFSSLATASVANSGRRALRVLSILRRPRTSQCIRPAQARLLSISGVRADDWQRYVAFFVERLEILAQ